MGYVGGSKLLIDSITQEYIDWYPYPSGIGIILAPGSVLEIKNNSLSVSGTQNSSKSGIDCKRVVMWFVADDGFDRQFGKQTPLLLGCYRANIYTGIFAGCAASWMDASLAANARVERGATTGGEIINQEKNTPTVNFDYGRAWWVHV